MPTFETPYSITLPLPLSVDTDTPVADPQFEAADWQISYDFDPTDPESATWATAATLPLVIAGQVRLVLTSAEIGEHVMLHARLLDRSTPEAWLDTLISITPSQNESNESVLAALSKLNIQFVFPFQSNFTGKNGTTLKAMTGETRTFLDQACNAAGEPVDFRDINMFVVIEDCKGNDIQKIEDGQITKTENSYSFTTSTANSKPGSYLWSSRVAGTNEVIGEGDYIVEYAAQSDA